MTRHTPGEWVRNFDQIISIHTDEDGDHETLICDVFDGHDWWRANARLIEAAPRLLEALSDLVAAEEYEAAQCGFGESEMTWLDDARAALAQAR